MKAFLSDFFCGLVGGLLFFAAFYAAQIGVDLLVALVPS